MFFEARGESPSSHLGKKWVLDVVKNRRDHKRWGDTICDVVTQRAQFSWYLDHKSLMPSDPLKWEEYVLDYSRNNPIDIESWIICFLLAYQNYFYSHTDITDGALYYMTVDELARRGGKSWKGTCQIATIHNHVFFKYCKKTSLTVNL